MSFRKKGHHANSCDLLPCYGGHPEWHREMDAYYAIWKWQWDLIIMHPMCTALCVSGNHVYAKGKLKYNERLEAVRYTQELWNLAINHCDKVCMENPLGVLNSYGDFPKPQYIQPYQFGHDASKKTGLWLYGLDPIIPTKYIEPRIVELSGKEYKRWSNQTDSGQNILGPSKDRAKIRGETYSGIGEAMADQWG